MILNKNKSTEDAMVTGRDALLRHRNIFLIIVYFLIHFRECRRFSDLRAWQWKIIKGSKVNGTEGKRIARE